MTSLTPLDSHYDVASGRDVLATSDLAALYGRLAFPASSGGPYVFANFVSTLDGVVVLDSAHPGGGPISGNNQHDRMVMGLLRAVADVVIVGAGTLRSAPKHLWTAPCVYPALAESFESLRRALGKPEAPLNVFVTASGELDPELRVLRSGEAPVLIVTTARGASRLKQQGLPSSVRLAEAPGTGALSARTILEHATAVRPSDLVLLEGGPHLIADFFAESCVDELFLTLAPQLAGREAAADRLGLVAGALFAPEHPLWGTLVSLKRANDHLFLRYAFARAQ